MIRWPTKPLGEVCELVNGRAFKPNEWEEGGLPIIRIQNLNDPTKSFNYTTQALPEKFKVKRGDILLSWSGTPGTSFGCCRWDGPEGWLNQHIFNVQLGNEILPPFFIYQVSSKLDELIAKAHGGVGLQHITKSTLSSVAFAIPPLAEQDRIVKLMDEADELRKLRAQADRRTADLIPALFNDMFGDPLKKGVHVSSLPLGEVVNFGSGATPSKDNPEFWGGSTPWVSPKDMRAEEIFDAEDHVSAAAFEKSNLQLIPKDTVLIVVRGMILVHTIPIRLCRVPVAINQDMKALLPKLPIEPEFLRWALHAQHPDLLSRVSTAGHGTKKLDSDKLRAVTIPIPPLPLQKDFAARVTEIRAMESQQAVSRQRLDDLFQSMLHRAFQGEL